MKTLYILRHAKSSWASVEQLSDHERPLLEEGKKTYQKDYQLPPDKSN